jgi:hypothetical protein
MATVARFVGAGAGVEQVGAGSVAVSKAGCKAGNLIAFSNFDETDAGDASFNSGAWSNVQNLAGTLNTLTSFVNTTNRQVLVGRVTADGTCSGSLVVTGTGAVARAYEFGDVAAGPLSSDVWEANGEVGYTTSTTIADRGITSLGSNRLAVNFVHVRATNPLGPFTGETGGDWVEVAEYNSSTMTLQVQIAELPAPGTIDGGTITIPSAYWGVSGFALKPVVLASAYASVRIR